MERFLAYFISITYNIYKLTYIYTTVFSQWLERQVNNDG